MEVEGFELRWGREGVDEEIFDSVELGFDDKVLEIEGFGF